MDSEFLKLVGFSNLKADEISDNRGNLSVLQGEKIPFNVKRIFWISGVPKLGVRGQHGHFKSNQLLCCVQGNINISVIPPGEKKSINIELFDNDAFHLLPRHWITMQFSSPQDVLLVAADSNYDPQDVFLEPLK